MAGEDDAPDDGKSDGSERGDRNVPDERPLADALSGDQPGPDDHVDDRPGAPETDPAPGDPEAVSARHATTGGEAPEADREPELDVESVAPDATRDNPESVIEGLPPQEGPEVTVQERYRSEIGYLETYFRTRRSQFVDYQRLLNQARMAESYDEYLTKATLAAVGVGIVGAVLGVVLAMVVAESGFLGGIQTGIGGPVGSFVGANRFVFTALALALVLGPALGGATFVAAYYYPVTVVSSRRQEIEIVLPQAIVFMYALSYGGMNLTEILRSIADAEDTYGEVAREFDTVIRDLELFGNDTFTALQNLRNSTPSDSLEEFLDDLLGLLESGGEVSVFLEDAAQEYLEEARNEQSDFLETLAILSEVFVVAFVAAPLFLVVILVVISLVGGQTLFQVATLVYLVIPVGMAAFVVLVHVLSSPFAQTGHVEAPDRDALGDGPAGDFAPTGVAAWGEHEEPHRGPFAAGADPTPTADTEHLEQTAAERPSTHEPSLLERAAAAVNDGVENGETLTMPPVPGDSSDESANAPADSPEESADAAGDGTARAGSEVADEGDTADDAVDPRIREYRRARQSEAARAFLSNPLRLFRQQPDATLLLSAPAAIAVLVALVVGGVVPVGVEAFLNRPVATTTAVVVLPAAVALVPLTYYYERKRRREAKLAARFPDTLNILASANKMGIGLTEGLGLVVRSTSGLVADELRKVRNDIIWNASTSEALLAFGSRLEVSQLARTSRLLAEGLRSSGDLSRVLSVAAEDARSRYRLERDRRREMSSYIAIVVIGYLVYLLVLVLLDTSYLEPVAQTAAEQAEFIGDQQSPFSFTSVPIEEYQLLFFHSALVQGFGSGLLAGKLAENSVRSGLKYGLGLVAVAVATFALV